MEEALATGNGKGWGTEGAEGEVGGHCNVGEGVCCGCEAVRAAKWWWKVWWMDDGVHGALRTSAGRRGLQMGEKYFSYRTRIVSFA